MAELQGPKRARDSRDLRVFESGSLRSGELSWPERCSSGHSTGTCRPLQPLSRSLLSLRSLDSLSFTQLVALDHVLPQQNTGVPPATSVLRWRGNGWRVVLRRRWLQSFAFLRTTMELTKRLRFVD